MDGLRKVGAIALAVVGFGGTAVLGGVGASAQGEGADEFAIPASEYAIGDTSALNATVSGPAFAFVDVNNDGVFNGTDYAHTLGVPPNSRGATPRVAVDLATEGFVIPAGVRSVNAQSISIRSDSGRIEVGAGLSMKSREGIELVGGNLVVGTGAKLQSQWGTYLDAPRGTVTIRDGVKVKAFGGIAPNAPANLHIGRDVSLLAPESGIELLDPDQELRIGAGTKFVADVIEFGVGLGDEHDGRRDNVFAVEDGVTLIARELIDIDNFGTNPMVLPAGVTLKARTIDLLGGDGPLTISGRIRAQDLYVRSNHSITFAGAQVALSAEGRLDARSNSSVNVRTPLTFRDAKIGLGRNGLLNVWTNSPIDASKMKPAEKTVFVNGFGSGPRARVMTVNMVRPQATSGVTIMMRVGTGQPLVPAVTCPATTNPCVGSFVSGTDIFVTPTGPRPGVISGQCVASNGYAHITTDRNCTVTFS